MRFDLTKEDYEEACCCSCGNNDTSSVLTGREIMRLDEYLSRRDYAGAERHLRYWVAEADQAGDMRAKLTLLNEQIGLYRKISMEAEGLRAIGDALALVDTIGMTDTISHGTTLVNAATGLKAFGRAKEALPLYRRAQTIYEANLDPSDEKLGGLYNNMALALTELGEYADAEALYEKAMGVMQQQPNGALEIAITCLNLADLVVAQIGHEAGEARIEEYLDRAEKLLDTEGIPHDGYYAFVCEKCAPVFGYYGYFLTEADLNERARAIYERD